MKIGVLGSGKIGGTLLGGPEQAGLVDALLRIWFTLAVQQGMGRRLGFKVLTP